MILCIFFILVVTLTGCLSEQWEMLVSPKVNGSEEHRVVLPCTFSHPNQDTYTGQIHVKWIKGRARPFFQCKLMNSTGAGGDECSGYVAAGRFSLSGDPRFRDLSLLVSKLWLNDTGLYFCRVELESNSYQKNPGTMLNVTGPGRVVSLSQMPFPHNSTLECVGTGNPPPEVSWFSSSKEPVQASGNKAKSQDQYTVRSFITISTNDVYTCQAKNSLGSDVRMFPPSKRPTALAVWLSILAGLLLLGALVGATLLWMKRRGASVKMDVCRFQTRERQKTSLSDPNPGTEIPIYANCSERYGEQQLVYADVDHSSSNPSTLMSPPHRMENDIIYSDVNLETMCYSRLERDQRLRC